MTIPVPPHMSSTILSPNCMHTSDRQILYLLGLAMIYFYVL